MGGFRVVLLESAGSELLRFRGELKDGAMSLATDESG